ncbi:hypothetical protein BCR32DRAFT_329304 [Anaeromyces robustus]|jgi:serine protease inhibitor|uniref:CBM10 domain-containing protein n=1 Tax=Anaeromyces robustus TaxID=1754192 RepID=A0A1Y1WT35_9FUNG|nr:hypothetical protein BCR32DRAFT_329304 [Anaeromyces robustus]|eukprot:ORX76555.1 hypothetical protein BCR32DRAFT_329304 [Anaeromyces robustus]
MNNLTLFLLGLGLVKVSCENCFSIKFGYPCCNGCDVIYVDEDGKWSVENDSWCGLMDSCENGGIEDEDIIDDIFVNNNNTDTSKKDFEFLFLKLENHKENMLYSPLSIEYALNMLQEGADGNTYDEINKIIGNDELPKYTNIENNLSLANGVFIKDTFYENVKTDYINTLKEKFDSEVIQDPFESAENVNHWIEDKTLGIIKNVVNDDAVRSPAMAMLLINALAMDMDWKILFDSYDTNEENFYMENGQRIQVSMMNKKEIKSDVVSYYKSNKVKAVTMEFEEYNGTELEFLALMPNEDLSSFVENITLEQIQKLDQKLIPSSETSNGVNLKIPKFKFSYDLALKKNLMDLGINDAFDELKANFTKISDPYSSGMNLFVSDALHKADIEFTEKGVKAAAVTVALTYATSFRPKKGDPIEIVIDKPFMFIIRDKNTKDIWFTGTVYEPELWGNN